jgi:hypothetical protein
MQHDLKTTAETVQDTAAKIQQNTTTQQQIAEIGQETNQAVRQAAASRVTTTNLIQETNDIAKAISETAKTMNDMVRITQTQTAKMSYASALSSNAAPLSRPITISTQTSSFI